MPEETLIAGRYQLLEMIGSGGEARVFRARDLQTAEDVAVRLPHHPQTSSDGIIPVPYHEGWVRLISRDDSYQIFELLKGQTLKQSVQSQPLEHGEWLDLIRQSLDAVEALHLDGWVHGDLNAENFLKAGEAWKLLELPFLRSAASLPLFGSIHTIAPEQLRGQVADIHSDLYALGCLFYFAAVGEFPHPGSSRQEVAISHLRFPPSPLPERVQSGSRETAFWVMRLLESDPAQRPPSIAAARRLLAVA